MNRDHGIVAETNNDNPPMLDNVLISTYTHIYEGIRTNRSGPVKPLLNFFRDRSKTLFLLEQPMPGSDFLDTRLSSYKNGKIVEQTTQRYFFANNHHCFHPRKTHMRLKLRDLVSNLLFLFKHYHTLRKKKISVFIGLECLNAAMGVILKKLGLVDIVVYYIFDWALDRYPNPIMNKAYIYLDKIATYYSDYTWNITYTIEDGKIDALNFNPARMSPQLYVPYCVDIDDSFNLPDENIQDKLVVFSGDLIEENGPLLLIEAFVHVVKKHPDAKLLIIGGEDLEPVLRETIQTYSMEENIKITGYIKEESKVVQLQQRGCIGVAPFAQIKGSRKYFGDVIKIRMYFACGLPVVSTPVPPVIKEIREENLGIVTDDDSPESLSNAILSLLDSKERLADLRKNVIAKAKKSNWQDNYRKAFKQMGIEL